MAFGSKPVEELFQTWRQSVLAIIRADRMIGIALDQHNGGHSSGIEYLDTWNELEEQLRPAQRAARKSLAEAVAVELRSRSATESQAPEVPSQTGSAN
jgi:hypothetical protein